MPVCCGQPGCSGVEQWDMDWQRYGMSPLQVVALPTRSQHQPHDLYFYRMFQTNVLHCYYHMIKYFQIFCTFNLFFFFFCINCFCLSDQECQLQHSCKAYVQLTYLGICFQVFLYFSYFQTRILLLPFQRDAQRIYSSFWPQGPFNHKKKEVVG